MYADHASLWRTQSVLHEKGVIRMPDDARELVESVYEEWIPAPDGLQRISDTVFGLKASEKGAAAQMLPDRDTGYDRNASGVPRPCGDKPHSPPSVNQKKGR